MATRIYALAKQLGVDSKQLVDICSRAGIRGKGSALAGLDDQEVAKVKEHLVASRQPKRSIETAPTKPTITAEPLTREQYIAPSGTREQPSLREKTGVNSRRRAARPAASKAPFVRVAALPESGSTATAPGKSEDVAQEPIMRLSKDAAQRAPLERFTKGGRGKLDRTEGPAPAKLTTAAGRPPATKPSPTRPRCRRWGRR